MAKYNTKQKEYILKYIESNKDKHITALEIQDTLLKEGKKVSMSTIYRTLKDLVIDNKIVKYENVNDEYSCYQYLTVSADRSHHFKCIKCNTLYHFKCKTVDAISMHIKNEHNFTIDNLKTIYYGICDICEKSIGE